MLPNRLHRQGAELLWRRAFLADTTIESWWIGVTGLGVPDDPERRPDHTSGGTGDFGIDADTTYADVTAYQAGAWSSSHLAMMEYASEQETTFTMLGGGRCESSEVTFSNEVPWQRYDASNCGGWLADGVYAPNRTSGEYDPVAGSYPVSGFPWSIPIFWPGEWIAAWTGSGPAVYVDGDTFTIETSATVPSGTWTGARVYLTDRQTCTKFGPYTLEGLDGTNLLVTGDMYALGLADGITYHFAVRAVDADVEAIEANPWIGASFPVAAVYLAAKTSSTTLLVATALIGSDVVLFNNSANLSVIYRSLVRGEGSGMRLTGEFCRSLAARMLGSGSTWASLQVGLTNVDVSTLTPDVELDDLTEIDGDGYSRLTPVGWSVTTDVDDEPTATLELPDFENTGDVSWPDANAAFLVGTVDGSEKLMAVATLSESVELASGETLDVGDMAFPWEGADHGG